MDVLGFDKIIFKASHNSYERDETLSEQLKFNSNKPYNCGCMGLELDIWRHSSAYTPSQSINKNYFTVSHTTPGSTTLSSYFNQILEWHNGNPKHNVVLITLDIKSSEGGYDNFHNEIDTYLKCYFNENLIFKPKQLIKNAALSLCENVINTGWPAISASELIGKFIFCLSGNKDWKSTYAKTNLNARYCFSDLDKSDSDDAVSPPIKGDIVFFNFHIYDKNKGIWLNTIPLFAKKRLITRAFIANSENNWNNCIKANVSAIATDKVSNHDWAKVSDSRAYRVKANN